MISRIIVIVAHENSIDYQYVTSDRFSAAFSSHYLHTYTIHRVTQFNSNIIDYISRLSITIFAKSAGSRIFLFGLLSYIPSDESKQKQNRNSQGISSKNKLNLMSKSPISSSIASLKNFFSSEKLHRHSASFHKRHSMR